MDLQLKWERVQRAGAASYWIVDPAGPSLVAWQLVDGSYVEVAQLGRDDTWTATAPYDVTIRPGNLLG